MLPTIRFTDAGKPNADHFLVRLSELALESPIELVTDKVRQVDIQFSSVQIHPGKRISSMVRNGLERRLRSRVHIGDSRERVQNPRPQGKANMHVWFTGENVRPPACEWDGYFSFDLDPMGDRNVYLPLWWHEVGLVPAARSPFTTADMSVERLMASRDLDVPPEFVCAFISNPHPQRLRAIRQLQEYGRVDVYGPWSGRHAPDKAELASRYKFVLAFENDLYPGYVTEKPFEAWASGSVPLWWGMDPAGFLNPAAMINAADYMGVAAFASQVATVAQDRDAWLDIAVRPILLRRPDLGPALNLLRSGVK